MKGKKNLITDANLQAIVDAALRRADKNFDLKKYSNTLFNLSAIADYPDILLSSEEN